METAAPADEPAALVLNKPWTAFAQDKEALGGLEEHVFYPYMRSCRWFAGKARTLSTLRVNRILSFPAAEELSYFMILQVAYTYGDEEHYAIPVSFLATGDELAGRIRSKALITKINVEGKNGWLIDAVYDPRFQLQVFDNIFHNAGTRQAYGLLKYNKGRGLEEQDENMGNACSVPDIEQSNSSLIYGDKYFFKLYRKLFREINPEVEMLQFLTETGGFKNIPAYAGSLSYERPGLPPVTLGLMMQKVASRSDSWAATGDDLNNFLFLFVDNIFGIQDQVFEKVELLGRRTAEMHLALLKDKESAAFKPESYNAAYIDYLSDHFNILLRKRISLLKENYARLDANARPLADDFLKSEDIIRRFFEKVSASQFKSLRIRIHGDYHLGQVLFTGSDYLVIDFEGEPESAIANRKIKHSPLKDVAGMIRSFHYAVCAKLYFSAETQHTNPLRLQKAADRWYRLITDAYTDAYLNTMGDIEGIFGSRAEMNFLLQLHLLEKAVYELGYELNGRPDWIRIPLKGIQQVLFEIEKFNS